MAFAPIAHTGATSTNQNAITTPAIDTTGATLLVIVLGSIGGQTVSDSKGNTWTVCGSPVDNNPRCQIYYAKNPTVGTGHTFTGGAATTYPSITVSAWSGADLTAPFDQVNNLAVNATQTTIQPGSITPTQAGELVICGLSTDNAGTHTIDSSFTVLDDQQFVTNTAYSSAHAYLIQTSAAAVNPTYTASVNFTAARAWIASFKAAAVVSPFPLPRPWIAQPWNRPILAR